MNEESTPRLATSDERAEFMRLWMFLREKLPADWRRQPGAEQAAWLMFLEMKTNAK